MTLRLGLRLSSAECPQGHTELYRSMLSIVVPVYNEEDSLKAFHIELKKVLSSLKEEVEIVFIDDGSTDRSLEILKSFAQKDKLTSVYSFKRNRGKADALALGFSVAAGEVLITMDADLQDKPSELRKLIEKHREGADVVVGWRRVRKDKSKMIIISKFFNYLNRILFGLKIHDIDCGFKLFTKEAIESLHIYGGLYRFIPLLLYQQGFIVDEVVVEHDARKFGKSKYGFSKVWKNLPDLFTVIFLIKFGKRPLHFFGFIGGLFAFVGFVLLAYLSYLHFLGSSIGDRPLLIFGALFFITGLQIFFTGFLADLMINISHNPKSPDENNVRFPLKYSTDK